MSAARIDYKASVAADLKRLDPPSALRVPTRVEKTLGQAGGTGEPLTDEFAGLYRLRVGDYRVIYARTVEGYLVLRIGHRRDVYERGRP